MFKVRILQKRTVEITAILIVISFSEGVFQYCCSYYAKTLEKNIQKIKRGHKCNKSFTPQLQQPSNLEIEGYDIFN